MKRIATPQLLLLLTLVFVSVSAGSQKESRSDVARPQSPLTKAILQVGPSVVQIEVLFGHLPERTKRYLEEDSDWQGPLCPDPCTGFGNPMGTGFLVNEDGYVITAKHVMDALREQPKVTDRQGQLFDFGQGKPLVLIQTPPFGEISSNDPAVSGATTYLRAYFSSWTFEEIDEDPIHDLALLKLTVSPFTTNPPALKTPNGEVKVVQVKAARFSLGRPDEGEPIAVSGYPLRSPVMVTTSGAIASSWEVNEKDLPLGPPGTFLHHLSDSYLADIHVNHGNSGGPVFSVIDGSVIGVCVSIVPDSMGGSPYNSGLASMIPAKYVIELLKKHNLKWVSTSTPPRTD